MRAGIHGYIRYYNEVCLKLRLKNLSSVQDRAQYLISVQVLGQVKVRSFF
ncbi:IS3 family transposase [Aggregatibacter segnis]